MRDVYDGIILGAGHNSLILQSYLGRAGLSTICLEPRAVAGGGLATVEQPPASGEPFRRRHQDFIRGSEAAIFNDGFDDVKDHRHGSSYSNIFH